MRRPLLVVTALFAAFTGWVFWQTGFVGFFRQLLATPAGWQVLADVCIALFLVLSWMRRDASQHRRRFWPWVALTVALGSLGPLLYLLSRPREARAPASTA
jgi:hypothetical protein